MRSILAGLRRLVIPWGAAPGSPQVVIGGSVPAALAALYASIGETIIGPILDRKNATNYTYQALVLESLVQAPTYVQGVSTSGNLVECLRLNQFFGGPPTYFFSADVVFHGAVTIDGGGSALPMHGEIRGWAGAAAPTGWALCDGAAVSRTTYAALFALINTVYGPGDGVNTFNLPNLKGRVPVGGDAAQPDFNALGKTGGETTHLLTTAETPSHVHAVRLRGDGAIVPFNVQLGAAGNTFGFDATGGNGGQAPDSGNSGAAGGGGAHNNLQPYIVINYIIKL